MALWRSKTCDEQQHKSENDRFVYSDKSSENDSFSHEDFDLSKAYSLELPLDVSEIYSFLLLMIFMHANYFG